MRKREESESSERFRVYMERGEGRTGGVRELQRGVYCPYRPVPESLLPNGAGVKGK